MKYDEEKGFGFIKPDRGSEDLHLGLEMVEDVPRNLKNAWLSIG